MNYCIVLLHRLWLTISGIQEEYLSHEQFDKVAHATLHLDFGCARKTLELQRNLRSYPKYPKPLPNALLGYCIECVVSLSGTWRTVNYPLLRILEACFIIL